MTEKTKLTLKRTIPFEREEMIARLKIEQKREDLQIICSKPLEGIPPRLKDHLKHFHLIDENNTLTKDGKRVRDTGMVFEPEYGRYEFWFIKNDPWLDRKLVAIRRITAGYNPSKEETPKEEKWKLPNSNVNEEETEVLDANTGEYVAIKYFKPEAQREGVSELLEGVLTCTAETDESGRFKRESEFKCDISADLSWSSDENGTSHLETSYPYHTDANKIIKSLLGRDYDETEQWVETNLIPKDPLNFYQGSGEIPAKSVGFDTAEIEKIQMHASTPKVAEKWLMEICRKKWGDHYVSAEEISWTQQQWLTERVFSGHDLMEKSAEEIMREFADSKEVFWNIAAMHDLRPQNIKCRAPFSIRQGEMEVEEMIRSNLFSGRNIQKIIISDRYIAAADIEKLKIILEGIDAEILVRTTLDEVHPPSGKNWTCEIFTKNNSNHDRYWLIKSKELGWEYWTFTHSLTPLHVTWNTLSCDESQITISPILNIPKELEERRKQFDQAGK